MFGKIGNVDNIVLVDSISAIVILAVGLAIGYGICCFIKGRKANKEVEEEKEL